MAIQHLFERTLNEFDRRLQAVTEDQWDAPTPCSEWNVRDLVNHVVYQLRWVPPLLNGRSATEMGGAFEGDLLGDDPKVAWKNASDEASSAVADPGVPERVVHHSSGDMPAPAFLSVAASDLIVHVWDLARAIGADEQLDPELVDLAESSLRPVADGWRAAGFLGDPVIVPETADAQARLLALAGRLA